MSTKRAAEQARKQARHAAAEAEKALAEYEGAYNRAMKVIRERYPNRAGLIEERLVDDHRGFRALVHLTARDAT